MNSDTRLILEVLAECAERATRNKAGDIDWPMETLGLVARSELRAMDNPEKRCSTCRHRECRAARMDGGIDCERWGSNTPAAALEREGERVVESETPPFMALNLSGGAEGWFVPVDGPGPYAIRRVVEPAKAVRPRRIVRHKGSVLPKDEAWHFCDCGCVVSYDESHPEMCTNCFAPLDWSVLSGGDDEG